MHRIDGPAAAPGGHFTEGDPNVGTPATVVTDDWANAVQEEICNVIEGAGQALAKPNNAQLLAAIQQLVSAATPAGAVMAFARSTAPAGWYIADGSPKNRIADAALFAAIGTVFGAGDGSTTFNLPELRAEHIRGWDAGRGIDIGRVFGSFQADDIKAHTHTLPSDSLDNTGNGYVADSVGGGIARTAVTGSTGATENRVRTVALLICIKR